MNAPLHRGIRYASLTADGRDGAGNDPPSTLIARSARFYSLCALLMAGLVFYVRLPFGSPGLWQISYYLLAAAMPMAAVGLSCAILGRAGGGRAVALVPVCLAFFLLPGLHPGLVWPVVLVAFLVIGAFLIISVGAPRPTVVAALALASSFALFHFFAMNSMRYANLFSPEIWLAGKLHKDTAFHSAISSMISGYGIASTGLDGLARLNYHILSHAWLGLLAKSAGLKALHGYFLGMQIVAVPLLFFSLSMAAIAFMERGLRSPHLLFLVLVTLSLTLGAHIWGWDSHLVSESYILGLILVLSGMRYLRELAENAGTRIPVAQLLVGLLIGTLAFATKVSVGFIWLAGLGFLLLRTRQLQFRHYAVLGAWAAGMAGLALTVVLPTDHVATTTFWPFHFFRYGPVAPINLAVVAIAAAVLAARLRSAPAGTRQWTEAVLVMLLASAVPALLFQFDGGAAFYFINVGTWIGVAALSAALLEFAGRGGSAQTATRYATLMAAATLAIYSAFALPTRFTSLRTEYHALLDAGGAQKTETLGPFSWTALQAMATAYDNSAGAQLLAQLQRHRVQGGSDVLLFVPPEAGWFWSSHTNCIVPPLGVPGITGLPMLMGVPPVELGCKLGHYYGYSSYGPQSRSAAMSDATLCDAALARGFGSVLAFGATIEARLLDCRKAGTPDLR